MKTLKSIREAYGEKESKERNDLKDRTVKKIEETILNQFTSGTCTIEELYIDNLMISIVLDELRSGGFEAHFNVVKRQFIIKWQIFDILA